MILTLLVPASFAWATGVHRVFEFKVALRAAVVLVVLAALGGLVYVAGEWLAAAWRRDLGSGLAGGALAFVALTAAVAGPGEPLAALARGALHPRRGHGHRAAGRQPRRAPRHPRPQ